MATYGIVGHRPRRRRSLTRPDVAAPPAPDLVGRLFAPERPDQTWVGDITWVPTDEGWLYLASVLDLAARRLVGWSMGEPTTPAWSPMRSGRPWRPAAGRGWTARSSTPTAAASTPRRCASMPVSGWVSGVPWVAPDRAWTTRSLNRSLPPSKSSLSTGSTIALDPRREPRSSAGSPGITAGGCTPPTATCPRSSGNNDLPLSRKHRPWPHEHRIHPVGSPAFRFDTAPPILTMLDTTVKPSR